MSNETNESTSDDLYEDLHITTLSSAKNSRSNSNKRQKIINQKSATASTSYNNTILGSNATTDFIDKHLLQTLQKQIEELKDENKTLKHNIGTLFRTAKAEISRKDAIISAKDEEISLLKNQKIS